MDMEVEQEPITIDAEPVEPAPAADTARAEPGPRALARLIEYGPGRHVALPTHTTYALIENPAHVAVPGAARYAYGLLTWQNMRLPLLDLNALLHPDSNSAPGTEPHYALIAAYQGVARGPLAYGAIGLAALPQTIAVGDEAQCPLPDDSKLWPLLALSCFQHEGEAVPILDTARLFGAYHG